MWRELEYELEDEYEFEDFGEYEVFPTDKRQVVRHTYPAPYRFICQLQCNFRLRNGARLSTSGTGTLISPRHVLTAAHVVQDDFSRRIPGMPVGYARASAVLVVPRRNGTDLPNGFSFVDKIRVAPDWQKAWDLQAFVQYSRHVPAYPQADFALLTLNKALGADPSPPTGQQAEMLTPRQIDLTPQEGPLGFWSHPRFGMGTRIRPYDPDYWLRLRVARFTHAGYPNDKCLDQPPTGWMTPAQLAACPPDDLGTMQWEMTDTFFNMSLPRLPRIFTHRHDTNMGQEGGPFWVTWEGARNLVGINLGGFASPGGPPPAENQGLRITGEMLWQLRQWMQADNVRATF